MDRVRRFMDLSMILIWHLTTPHAATLALSRFCSYRFLSDIPLQLTGAISQPRPFPVCLPAHFPRVTRVWSDSEKDDRCLLEQRKTVWVAHFPLFYLLLMFIHCLYRALGPAVSLCAHRLDNVSLFTLLDYRIVICAATLVHFRCSKNLAWGLKKWGWRSHCWFRIITWNSRGNVVSSRTLYAYEARNGSCSTYWRREGRY